MKFLSILVKVVVVVDKDNYVVNIYLIYIKYKLYLLCLYFLKLN